jgi:hypothetical protein
MSEQSRIIELWKENNIAEAVFTFTCGGDNMGDTEWAFKNSEGEDISVNKDIEDYFDTEVYKAVNFYVDSDGHYNGEAGTVKVELTDDDDEPCFTYDKYAESEYRESYVEVVEVTLTSDEACFIRKYVANMNGGDDATFTLNYKVDFLLTDEDEQIMLGLNESIDKFVCDFEPEGEYEGELNDWHEYTTDLNGEENEPQFKEGEPNTLLVTKQFSTTVFKSNND